MDLGIASAAYDDGGEAAGRTWSGVPWIVRCAWCERYQVGDDWIDLKGRLFQYFTAKPRVTHGICSDCFAAHTPPAKGSSQ